MTPSPAHDLEYDWLPTVAAGMGAIWTLTHDQVLRIDPETDLISMRIDIPAGRYDTLTVGLGAVWLVGQVAGTLLRVDPTTGSADVVARGAFIGPVATFGRFVLAADSGEGGGLDGFAPSDPKASFPGGVNAYLTGDPMVSAFGRLWVADRGGRDIFPVTRAPRPNRTQVASSRITALTSGLGLLWIDAGRLIAVDPRTMQPVADLRGVAPWRHPDEVPPRSAIAVLGHRVWVVDPVEQLLVGIRVRVKGGSSRPPVHTARGTIVHIPHPIGMVSAFGSLWVQSTRNHAVWRISPAGRVLAKIPGVSSVPPPGLLGGPGDRTLVAGSGSIWTLMGRTVARIDPATNEVTARIEVPGGSGTLAAGIGAVWVTGNSAHLTRIDPSANTVTNENVLTASASAITTESGLVWIGEISEAGGRLGGYDPVSGRFTETDRPANGVMMLGAFGQVWLAYQDGLVATLDPDSSRYRRAVDIGHKDSRVEVHGLAFGLGLLWLNTGRLVGIDPSTLKVAVNVPGGVREVRPHGAGVAVLGRRVWLADPRHGRIIGVDVCPLIDCN